ncbi:hypothetical protein HPP92_022449 [Vanilla planifolia]|uniref:Uncharacterized protein n=1 Tax=Vanilla planifolia TaxID=51239 RepID=A0A835PTJ3_VANPL|nr:hypothetical protein HPP92_022449 [Vanilla planifolia]
MKGMQSLKKKGAKEINVLVEEWEDREESRINEVEKEGIENSREVEQELRRDL